ncbi:hypothetical protein KC19_4G078200 [Ceratodon purpureus]|uniref:Uncharacterized protein n=1 Tax=Ceratodon purpureus TaxID=3225 RepID=A0A8T0I7V7_CERPU|nr:hypothetical protein KC19_4G078200 [Ceratodon purpureus]
MLCFFYLFILVALVCVMLCEEDRDGSVVTPGCGSSSCVSAVDVLLMWPGFMGLHELLYGFMGVVLSGASKGARLVSMKLEVENMIPLMNKGVLNYVCIKV